METKHTQNFTPPSSPSSTKGPTLENRVEALEKDMAIFKKYNGHFFVEEETAPMAAKKAELSETEKLQEALKTDQQRMTGTQPPATLAAESSAKKEG